MTFSIFDNPDTLHILVATIAVSLSTAAGAIIDRIRRPAPKPQQVLQKKYGRLK